MLTSVRRSRPASWMAHAMVDWWYTKYPGEVARGGRQGKTRNTYFRTSQGQIIKCVCPLSVSTLFLHTKQNKWLLQSCPSHKYTEDSIFMLRALCFVRVIFFFPRTLIKIHQKKHFQEQCLRMLPPPLSSIKSGSSGLKGDEKLSLTLCHTPVKRRAHSKQWRVQVLIYYFTQIIFLPFFLTMRTFTSQMELSVSAVGMCWPRVLFSLMKKDR